MDGLQIFSVIIGTSGVIGSFIVLATHIINRRIDDVNKRIDSLERRVERIEEDNKEIRKELSELKGDMREMKAYMVSMEKRMEKIESDVRDIKNLLYKIIDISQNLQREKSVKEWEVGLAEKWKNKFWG